MLLAILALDCAGFFHGDISSDAAAIVALVVGIVALVFDLRARGTF
jgi:hypothetical protein